MTLMQKLLKEIETKNSWGKNQLNEIIIKTYEKHYNKKNRLTSSFCINTFGTVLYLQNMEF